MWVFKMPKLDVKARIKSLLKNQPEQRLVVGPIVEYLCSSGWSIDQICFGKNEWFIPKTPSDLTKREKHQRFNGFPVDIAVFDDPEFLGDPSHILFIIECKQPSEDAGISQLQGYFVGEPYAQLGIWANNPDVNARAVFVYRNPNASMLIKRYTVNKIPRPGEQIKPDVQRITFNDLIPPSEDVFRKIISDLLDKVVINDTNVTRREEQLDQLCNILLLKLDSDKRSKVDTSNPVLFQIRESRSRTAKFIRQAYEENFVNLYPDIFISDPDKKIRLSDETLYECVDALSGLRLIDNGISTIGLAFQILRSEALKQGEGQYFTPQSVIEAGVKLLQIRWEDIVIDPACGTGGFLVECMMDMKRKYPQSPDLEISRWAQTHIYGIEKDAIGVKLTKAIMQIAGDGSAHCARGDSVRVHKWPMEFPHLIGTFTDGRFSVVVTNPPFGKNLKVSAEDSRLSRLIIAKDENGNYQDLEIGLIFLQRAYQLLRVGGRIGIVLPETYFFSKNYAHILEWIKPRMKPIVVVNIPMEAFQGFCRAKTNFYVFEKIAEVED